MEHLDEMINQVPQGNTANETLDSKKFVLIEDINYSTQQDEKRRSKRKRGEKHQHRHRHHHHHSSTKASK